MPLEIISFDFDGTLVHPNVSTEDLYYDLLKDQISYPDLQNKFKSFENEYLNNMPQLKNDFRNLGKLDDKEREKLYYRWNTARLQYIFPDLHTKQLNILLEKIIFLINTKQTLEVYPDVYEALNLLKRANYSLKILSGNNSAYIRKHLEKFSLDHIFDSILTPDVWNMEKKNLYTLYSKNVRQYSRILHIGDDPEIDYLIPKRYGIHTLWIQRYDNRYIPENIEKNDIIRSLNEIPEKIEQLNKNN